MPASVKQVKEKASTMQVGLEPPALIDEELACWFKVEEVMVE